MTENITLEEAKKMADKAIEKAKEIGIKISVAVYDVNGHLVLLEKMDDAAWITPDLAMGKAFTAVAFRLLGEKHSDSGAVGRNFSEAQSLLFSLSLKYDGKVIGRQGGLPIIKNGAIAGGVGVSGGSPDQDEACAKAALS
ncbi:MAG: GlcG/HbpS family heme-binding protein [Nitrososphaeria archaeon]